MNDTENKHKAYTAEKRGGISENNIKSILRRTRIKLKEFLEKEGVTL